MAAAQPAGNELEIEELLHELLIVIHRIHDLDT